MKRNIIVSVIVVVIIVAFYLYINKNNTTISSDFPMSNNLIEESVTKNVKEVAPPVNNVNIINGKQVIDIRAKGGYQPRNSIAKAGLATVLQFSTNGTFDCSASVRIPSMNISKVLPQTGVTDIEIGVQDVKILKGSCGMGMYTFEIEFK